MGQECNPTIGLRRKIASKPSVSPSDKISFEPTVGVIIIHKAMFTLQFFHHPNFVELVL